MRLKPAGLFPFEKGNRKTFIKFILNALGAVVFKTTAPNAFKISN